jgi:hypothetical protein
MAGVLTAAAVKVAGSEVAEESVAAAAAARMEVEEAFGERPMA